MNINRDKFDDVSDNLIGRFYQTLSLLINFAL